MVMGADVTHNVVGISIAGVVATTNASYTAYFHELRGQTPFQLNGSKTRLRQSEERILDLTEMAVALLQRWKTANCELPEVVFYYRDGVSDGQFVNVLKLELNLLDSAFKNIGGADYSPKLIIIVGQKRHQTRFFREGVEEGKKQVLPGTVVSDGIAQPSHMNFFLVSQKGIQGTSVPCHYHVLHFDDRLIKEGYGVNDLELITYQLCHLYSRADKTVGYATPAYMADHLCERGKDYLETKFHTNGNEQDEEEIKKNIEERVAWLNNVMKCSEGGCLNGLQIYC